MAAPDSTRDVGETGGLPRRAARASLALLADGLTVARIGGAIVFPWALAHGGWGPLGVFTAAALTDYLDGPLARRSGRTAHHGAVLDVAADVAFVLSGLGAAAAQGRVTWAAPAAIVASVTAYVVASVRLPRDPARPRLARSRLGHAAGIANYVLIGLVCGAVALPGPLWRIVLALGGLAVTGLNLGAVVARLRPGR